MRMLTGLALAAATVLLTLAAPLRAASVTDEQVGQAADKLRAFLYTLQKPDGSWDLPKSDAQAAGAYEEEPAGTQYGGQTALVVQSLLVGGDSPQKPQLARALQWLRQLEMRGTYAVSVRAHVWGQLPDAYHDLLRNDADWLVNAANPDSSFHYTSRQGTSDNSTSQYGWLGLWEAAKRNIRVRDTFWKEGINYWLTQQNVDGGWEYGVPKSGKSKISMTCAGLTALFIAQQELYRGNGTPDPKLTSSINQGLRWLDQNFAVDPGYCLYCVERVAMASGVKEFKGQDWFRAGADVLVRKTPTRPIDAAFYLLFLARGRVPVWVTKLSVPGRNWNNRPNDIYFLTHYLSNYREGEINWQVMDVDRPAEDLRTTPLLYLTTDHKINLSDEQKLNLKRYLDLGGMLLANPENNSSDFLSDMRQTLEWLYPKLKIKPIESSHPLFSVHNQISGGGGQSILGLNNGVRDLVFIPQADWGMQFQSEQGPTRSASWKTMTNLFVLATDRGVLENRLVDQIEHRLDLRSTDPFTLGRARYAGSWLPEPLAWVPLSNTLFNRTNIELFVTPGPEPPKEHLEVERLALASNNPIPSVSPQTMMVPRDNQPVSIPEEAKEVIDLDKIGESDVRLVHLTGVEPLKLSQEQAEAIKKYTRRGGTILIETVGGKGSFAQDLETQLLNLMGAGSVPLPPDHPILTGQGLEHGFDNTEVVYRRYAVWKMSSPTHRPRLAAFYVDGRPAIIISQEDLSLGLLDIRHWGIPGYTPESAKKLFVNLILYAKGNKMEPAMEPALDAAAAEPVLEPH